MSSNTVISFDNNIIDKMLDFYKEFLVSPPRHTIFQAKKENCVITAYKSGKVMFQGKDIKSEVELWTKYSVIESDETIIQEDIIGSDEVGTGDFFGPVVVCAVYIRPGSYEKLYGLGITDSKNISDKKILKLVKSINKLVDYNIIMLDNEKFNALTKKGYNMNKIKAILHNQAIATLLEKLDKHPQKIVIDQFCTQEKFSEYLNNYYICSPELTFETKAESKYIAVAAASILARYTFLKAMAKLNKHYDNLILKGAGKKVNDNAELLVNRYGLNTLNRIAKINFKNYKDIQKKKNK